MQTLFVYLLKVIIYSGILFGYYHVALRNKRFHYYNRFYLLMSVALSLLLPFLQLEIWQWKSSNPKVIDLAGIMVTNQTEREGVKHSFSISGSDFILFSYIFIAACLLLSFASGLLKIIRMKNQYPSEKVGDILFIHTDLQQAPFSFFKSLFWKSSIDISEETGRQIFRHELAHIEQKHSSDKLFLQLVTLLFWLNPFYWLIQKELSLIHEFIADEKAIDNKDAEAFALMLLQSQFGKNTFLPLQSFYYSPIKRRLRMLTSSSKTSYNYARRILALPVLSLCILLFAFKLGNNNQPTDFTRTNAPFTLVVDAGHGGDDNGAIGSSDATEKIINLSIAKKVAELASNYGITVKMTRTEDATVSLEERIRMIQKAQPDACVSIHVNATEEKQTSSDAFQVFITKNKTGANYNKSRLLGSSLIQSVKTNFPVDAEIMQRTQGIYVLDQNPYPAVIVECGYMNNEKSLQQLTNDAGVEIIAKDILRGVVAYANNNKEAETRIPDEVANLLQGFGINTDTIIKQETETQIPKELTNHILQDIATHINKQHALTILSDTTVKQPLYILDGKEISAEEMKAINPDKIESINVLKGKEATDKYGKKGENGVVIITLKKINMAPSKPVTITRDKNNSDTTKVPLYIIDGKEIEKAELDKVSPEDIESISVLKADNATIKYGSKAQNGVVIITKKNMKTKG